MANVETYPTESVRAAVRMVTAAPEKKAEAQRIYSATLMAESRALSEYIIAKCHGRALARGRL